MRGPHTVQLEKPCMKQRRAHVLQQRPSTAKNKINIKKNTLLCFKRYHQENERKPTEWGNHISKLQIIYPNGLLTRIHKELLQLDNKNTTQFKNVQRILIGISSNKIYKQP